MALTGPWTSPVGPVGSQLLWDTLILVPCEKEGEERWLGRHSFQDLSNMAPDQNILMRLCLFYEDLICTGSSKGLLFTGKAIGHAGREQLSAIGPASWITGTGWDWSPLSLQSIVANREIFAFQGQR